MNPLEAFTYLFRERLPLVLSFPLEEDRGHIVTGKGICYVQGIEGERVRIGGFSPLGVVRAAASQTVLHVSYEVEGETHGCALREIVFEGGTLTAEIPAESHRTLRKFVRVEPSAAAPVMLYLYSDAGGTRMYPVRDISEHGLGLVIADDLDIEKNLLCGVGLPFDGGTFILMRATVVYKMEVGKAPRPSVRPSSATGFAFGLEIAPHPEDLKKIRLYVMQRELEISSKIQTGI